MVYNTLDKATVFEPGQSLVNEELVGGDDKNVFGPGLAIHPSGVDDAAAQADHVVVDNDRLCRARRRSPHSLRCDPPRSGT